MERKRRIVRPRKRRRRDLLFLLLELVLDLPPAARGEKLHDKGEVGPMRAKQLCVHAYACMRTRAYKHTNGQMGGEKVGDANGRMRQD